MFKYLFIFFLIGATYQFFSHRSAEAEAKLKAVAAAEAAAAAARAAAAPPAKPRVPAVFILLPAPNKAAPEQVIIVSPPNCPKEDTQRAETLLAELRAANIPCELVGQAAFSVTNYPDEDRINAFMTGSLPLVFTRGKAASNPTSAEVLAEYRRAL